MTRHRLSNRRRCESFEFVHAGMAFTATVGFYSGGRPGELFLSSNKTGTPIESISRDAAIMASIAVQHGADLATIRESLTRDHDGGPATAIGAAIDIALENSGS
jgi:hypothetical protein